MGLGLGGVLLAEELSQKIISSDGFVMGGVSLKANKELVDIIRYLGTDTSGLTYDFANETLRFSGGQHYAGL